MEIAEPGSRFGGDEPRRGEESKPLKGGDDRREESKFVFTAREWNHLYYKEIIQVTGDKNDITVYAPKGIMPKILDILNDKVPLTLSDGWTEKINSKGNTRIHFGCKLSGSLVLIWKDVVKSFYIIREIVEYVYGDQHPEINKFFEDYFECSREFDGWMTLRKHGIRSYIIKELPYDIDMGWIYSPIGSPETEQIY